MLQMRGPFDMSGRLRRACMIGQAPLGLPNIRPAPRCSHCATRQQPMLKASLPIITSPSPSAISFLFVNLTCSSASVYTLFNLSFNPMQLDSHRRQLSLTMPCRRWHRAPTAYQVNDLPQPSSTPDVETWRDIRKYNLRMMRKQVRSVVFFMALLEAIRVGPVQIVFAGKDGYSYPAPAKDDFGVSVHISIQAG
jgi:hypothetical protein